MSSTFDTRNRIIEVVRRGQRGLDGDVGLTTTVTKSTTFTSVAGERGYVYRATAPLTINFEQASTLTNGWHCIVDAVGGNVTLNPFGAETINGLSTLVVAQNGSALVYSDGTSLYARFFFGSAYTALNGLPTAADKYIYGTGAGAWAEGDINANGRDILANATTAGAALMDDADASAQRTTLGLGAAAVLNTSADDDFANTDPSQLAVRTEIYDQMRVQYGVGNSRYGIGTDNDDWEANSDDKFLVGGVYETTAMFPWDARYEFPREFEMVFFTYYPGSGRTDRDLLLQPLDQTGALINAGFFTELGVGTDGSTRYQWSGEDGVWLNTGQGSADGNWRINLKFSSWPALGVDRPDDGSLSQLAVGGRFHAEGWSYVSTNPRYFRQVGAFDFGDIGNAVISGFRVKCIGSSAADLNQINVQYRYRKIDLMRYPTYPATP